MRGGARGPDRHAGADPRAAGRLHRLRLPVAGPLRPATIPATAPPGPGRAAVPAGDRATDFEGDCGAITNPDGRGTSALQRRCTMSSSAAAAIRPLRPSAAARRRERRVLRLRYTARAEESDQEREHRLAAHDTSARRWRRMGRLEDRARGGPCRPPTARRRAAEALVAAAPWDRHRWRAGRRCRMKIPPGLARREAGHGEGSVAVAEAGRRRARGIGRNTLAGSFFSRREGRVPAGSARGGAIEFRPVVSARVHIVQEVATGDRGLADMMSALITPCRSSGSPARPASAARRRRPPPAKRWRGE